uniref:ZC3H15/TMA46 family C-terminal domain-containing protein n=1 Tax=Compsopogon caeruleus TaxID=31354 RepID=A0A7S1TF65_9RHOD|mmetsp:Transcript_4523/g.9022  ORF Transcript_4523/g.9022 Transcript_4523/m.9022 type:complete len:268 (+) Transcript_4523:135-938(+)
MPPKAAQKKVEKIVEDKTFGLKNKNKSKKVQQYVAQVQKQAKQQVGGNKPRRVTDAEEAEKKTSKKAMLAARMAELDMVLKPVKEKDKSEEARLAEEERRRQEEEEAERLRILSLPVEEQIEAERERLKVRTPVTLELFMQWKEEKRRKREEEEKRRREAALKGLSKVERARGTGLSGRELFAVNKQVFVDDEAADDTKYEVPIDYIDESDEDPSQPGFDTDDDGVEDVARRTTALDVDDETEPGEGDAEEEEGAAGVTVGDEELFS